MRLPPPKEGWYDTLSIEFKDGCFINLPYFDRESSEYYIQRLSKDIKSFKIIPYTGSLPVTDSLMQKELDKV